MGCSSENRVFILVGFQKACCLHTFLVQSVRAVVYAIAPGDAAVFYADSLEELLVSQGCKAGEVVNFFTSKNRSSLLVNLILSMKSLMASTETARGSRGWP